MSEIKEPEIIKLWAQNYPEVMRWLSKIQKKDYAAFNLYRYCQWAGKLPQELLALKSNPTSRDAEKLLDDFVKAPLQFTNSVKVAIVTAVKSFYKHNYQDLARASGQIEFQKKTEYNKLSKENLRKLWTWALNPRDKALLTFVNSTAIAKETLSELKWKHLEDDWEKKELPCINIPPELLKGGGIGKYRGVRQITFLTPEAKRDLINYKEWIEQKLSRKVTSEDNIWLSTYTPYNSLSYAALGVLAQYLSKQTGIRWTWHDARRWVNTALEQIGISSNWARKIRGRKVRGEESPYSQPSIDALRVKFKEAVPLIEFTSETQIANLEERAKTVERLTNKLIAGEPWDAKDREDQKRYSIQLREAANKPKSNCGDGTHCQRIVEESELETLLGQGWHVVTCLPSGKVVISNESS